MDEHITAVLGATAERSESLRILLKHFGLTHRGVARVLKCTRSTVSHWVHGRKWPRRKTMVALMSLFSVNVAPSDVKDPSGRVKPRAAALNDGKVTYLADRPCKRGHYGERHARYGCVVCYHQRYSAKFESLQKIRAERSGRLRKISDGRRSEPCMDCGIRFPLVCMDFDHRDRSTKRSNVSRLVIGGAAMKTFLREIELCDVVCSNCHRIREATRANWKTGIRLA